MLSHKTHTRILTPSVRSFFREHGLRRSLLFLLLFFAFCDCGCAAVGRYLENRLNDLADCVTARAGWAFGLGVRFSITHYVAFSAGGYYSPEKAGYLGRRPVTQKEGLCLGLPLLQVLSPLAPLFAQIPGQSQECGSYAAATTLFLFSTCFRSADNQSWLLGLNFNTLSSDRQFRPPPPPQSLFIEFGLALGFIGFDVGFNPAEILDFVLGIFGLDMMGDDE